MSKSLASFIMCCVVFLTPFAQADDTLVLSLSFDEGAGKTVFDASGYGNNGSIKGDVAWVAGKYGSALSFDGQSGFIEIPHAPSLDVESAFTQTVWAYPMDVAREQNVAEKGFWAGSWLSHIKTVRGYVFAIAASGWQPIWLATSADSALNAEEWAHLAITWDGTTRALYVNGKLDGTDEPIGQLTPNTQPLYIAGGRGNYYYKGIYDEFRLWNRALTQEEIVASMESSPTSVDASGKLATLWGEIRSE